MMFLFYSFKYVSYGMVKDNLLKYDILVLIHLFQTKVLKYFGVISHFHMEKISAAHLYCKYSLRIERQIIF